MHPLLEFIFPRRLHRIAYLVRTLVFNIVSGCVLACNSSDNPGFCWAFFLVYLIYGLFFIVIPRMRDAEMSRWWLAGCFLPVVDIIVSLILAFRAPVYRLGQSASLDEPGTLRGEVAPLSSQG